MFFLTFDILIFDVLTLSQNREGIFNKTQPAFIIADFLLNDW
jgi:hypothetical protein